MTPHSTWEPIYPFITCITPAKVFTISGATDNTARGMGPNDYVNSTAIRIAIADDHKLVAQSLGYALERHGFDVVGLTHSGRGALDLVHRETPDVLLLDLYMPDMSGFDVIKALRRSDVEVNILILTSSRDLQDVSRAIDIDVSGYLSKELSSEDLKDAVVLAAEGGSTPDLRLLETLFATKSASRDQEYGLVDGLTDQEFRVLRLLAEGLSNEEIASLLSVSVNTIKTHVKHIYQKLGVSDRTSAAVWAIRNGLLPLDAISSP